MGETMVYDFEKQFDKIENRLWDVFKHNNDFSSAIIEALTIGRNSLKCKNILVYHQSERHNDLFSIDEISSEEKEEIVRALLETEQDSRYV